MAMEFKIDFSGLSKKILKETFKVVVMTTSNTYSDIRKYSPVDTGKYLSGHKNLGVKLLGNKVIGTIENNGLYSEKVEKGWRKTPVNWNLVNIGQIYTSRGANVYQKAIAKNKDNFIKKLKG